MCHHLHHWADGGATDLGNAALLCGRHHTIVHRKGYHAELVNGRVVWHLTVGAYDHWLTTRHATAADRMADVVDEPACRADAGPLPPRAATRGWRPWPSGTGPD